jgi:hypothetical protein
VIDHVDHIDLSSVLRRAVCDLYSNLVTRPTGAAVREQIERLLAEARGRTLAVLDFTHVTLLDFSCADEVVAKLLLTYATGAAAGDAYFLFRGMSEAHLDAIEAALARYGLALVMQLDTGAVAILGDVTEAERRVWEALNALGRGNAESLAELVAMAPADVAAVLDGLADRRLVMRIGDDYVAVGVAVGHAA